MKLEFGQGEVKHSAGLLKATYPILDAREIENVIVVLYDYMAFSREGPSRNLFAYNSTGAQCWRAHDIGLGPVDGYTNIISEQPLVVGNFAGFNCTIDVKTGQVLSKQFTK